MAVTLGQYKAHLWTWTNSWEEFRQVQGSRVGTRGRSGHQLDHWSWASEQPHCLHWCVPSMLPTALTSHGVPALAGASMKAGPAVGHWSHSAWVTAEFCDTAFLCYLNTRSPASHHLPASEGCATSACVCTQPTHLRVRGLQPWAWGIPAAIAHCVPHCRSGPRAQYQGLQVRTNPEICP